MGFQLHVFRWVEPGVNASFARGAPRLGDIIVQCDAEGETKRPPQACGTVLRVEKQAETSVQRIGVRIRSMGEGVEAFSSDLGMYPNQTLVFEGEDP